MNWYAMMLDSRMREHELIREAQARRQIAVARGRRSRTAPPSSQRAASTVTAAAGPLQLFWRRFIGIQAR